MATVTNKDKVLDLLKGNKKALSEKEIAEKLGMSEAAVVKIVNEGLKDGNVKVATPETKEIDLKVKFNKTK